MKTLIVALSCLLVSNVAHAQARAPKSADGRRAAAPASATEAAPLVNSDVVAMVDAGLEEAVIAAAIRKAPATAFDVTPAALVALKKANVPSGLVRLMIDPAAPDVVAPSPAPASGVELASVPSPATGPGSAKLPIGRRDPGIYYEIEGGEPVVLEPTVFTQGKTGGMFMSAMTGGLKKTKIKAIVRNARANIRLADGTPVFYFYFESRGGGPGAGGFAALAAGATSPNEFVLAKMTPRNEERELINMEIGALGFSGGTRSKDTVPFSVERLEPGIYRVRPTDPLPPGEYCFFHAAGVSAMGGSAMGRLYDFGVDAAGGSGRD